MLPARIIRSFVCAVALALALVVSLDKLSAQAPDKQLPRIQLSGKIESMRAGFVQMNSDSLKVTYPKMTAKEKEDAKTTSDEDLMKLKHAVAVDQRVRVDASAMASVEFIKPGQGIRLSGKIDGNGVVANELNAVEVFVPPQNFQPTMDITVAFSGFVGDKKENVSPFKAEGIVMSAARGRLVIMVKDNQRIQATVAAEAKVMLASKDLSLAQVGDKISVTGRLVAPGQVQAESVSVTLSSLPGQAAKKGPATTTTKKVEPVKKGAKKEESTEEKKADEKKTEKAAG